MTEVPIFVGAKSELDALTGRRDGSQVHKVANGRSTPLMRLSLVEYQSAKSALYVAY